MIDFVQQALREGRSRGDISDAMQQAGWSENERSEALDAFSETDFSPPVPRPRNIVSARDFFIYCLTYAALGATAVYLVLLLHALVDAALETERLSRYNYREIRGYMAVLLVSTPVYLWLSLRERRRLGSEPELYRSAIRKWATYIALLIAAIVFLINVMVALAGFLNGDLTLTFALKLAVIAAVSGGVFWFYIPDVEGPK